MRFISTCLLLCLLPSIAEAQLFRRRERYAPRPDGNCQPYSSPEHPRCLSHLLPRYSRGCPEYVDIPLDADHATSTVTVSGMHRSRCLWVPGTTSSVASARMRSRKAGMVPDHQPEAACKTAGIEYRTERNGKTDILTTPSLRVCRYTFKSRSVVLTIMQWPAWAERSLRLHSDNNGPPVVQKWSRSKFNLKKRHSPLSLTSQEPKAEGAEDVDRGSGGSGDEAGRTRQAGGELCPASSASGSVQDHQCRSGQVGLMLSDGTNKSVGSYR